MSLTDTYIKNTKPKDTDYKLTDEKGMYLFVKATGASTLGWIIVLPVKERR